MPRKFLMAIWWLGSSLLAGPVASQPLPVEAPAASSPAPPAAASPALPEAASPAQSVAASPAPAMPVAPATVPPQAQNPAFLQQIRGAQVGCTSSWFVGQGLVLGDRRTVVTQAQHLLGLPSAARPFLIEAAPPNAPAGAVWSSRVQVLPYDDEEAPFLLLRLAADAPATPLLPSPEKPVPGGEAWVVRPSLTQRDTWIPVRTTLAEVGPDTLAVAAPVTPGSYLLDREGRLLGLVGRHGLGIRAARLTDPQALQEPPFTLLPFFGIKLGLEQGGPLQDGSSLLFDVGLTFDDRWAVVVTAGFGWTDGPARVRLDPPEGIGPGIAERISTAALLTGELRYRLLLSRPSTYLDLALGARYTLTQMRYSWPALHGSQPGCDPTVADATCDLVVREPPERTDEHGFGPLLGVDLRVHAVTLGYRYQPGGLSYQLPDAHLVTFGLAGF